MFGNKHILRCQLWKCCKFFLGLGENLTRMSEDDQVLARWGKHREPDIDHTDKKIQDGINHGTEIREE